MALIDLLIWMEIIQMQTFCINTSKARCPDSGLLSSDLKHVFNTNIPICSYLNPTWLSKKIYCLISLIPQ